MEPEHSIGASAPTLDYRRTRRAYELGRLASSLVRGGFVTGVIGLVAWATQGSEALALLPFSLLTWVFVYWRGTSVLRGASFGLLGGSAAALLPMSILRPCCDFSAPAGADCCTMPGACLLAGAAVSLVAAAFVPLRQADSWRTSAGMALGMSSVAIMKCSTLFLGEALGLIGGLLLGMLISSAARAAWGARLAGR